MLLNMLHLILVIRLRKYNAARFVPIGALTCQSGNGLAVLGSLWIALASVCFALEPKTSNLPSFSCSVTGEILPSRLVRTVMSFSNGKAPDLLGRVGLSHLSDGPARV